MENSQSLPSQQAPLHLLQCPSLLRAHRGGIASGVAKRHRTVKESTSLPSCSHPQLCKWSFLNPSRLWGGKATSAFLSLSSWTQPSSKSSWAPPHTHMSSNHLLTVPGAGGGGARIGGLLVVGSLLWTVTFQCLFFSVYFSVYTFQCLEGCIPLD